jgi:Spy/CpxP family protein refolding chaperone
MKKDILLIASCAIGLTSLLPFAALADDDGAMQNNAGASSGQSAPSAKQGGGGHRHRHSDELLKSMLTPDQTKKYDAITAASRAEMAPLVQQLATLKQASATDAKSEQKAQDLRDQMAKIHRATKEKVDAILTADQKVKLKELRAQRKDAKAAPAGQEASTTN